MFRMKMFGRRKTDLWQYVVTTYKNQTVQMVHRYTHLTNELKLKAAFGAD